jgi:hypothetical protein
VSSGERLSEKGQTSCWEGEQWIAFLTPYSFLHRTPIAQEIRVTIDKGDCIKLEIFCTAKETIIETGDNRQKGRKFLPVIH